MTKEERPSLGLALKAAITDALPVAELETIKDGQDRATQRFLAGQTSQSEYNQEIAPYLDFRGALEFGSPEEFEEALRTFGLPEDTISEMVSHELAHFTTDRAQGLDPTFMIQFFRHPDGAIGLYPSVKSGLAGRTPAEQRKLLKRSLEAPEQLSPRDLRQLRGE